MVKSSEKINRNPALLRALTLGSSIFLYLFLFMMLGKYFGRKFAMEKAGIVAGAIIGCLFAAYEFWRTIREFQKIEKAEGDSKDRKLNLKSQSPKEQ